MSYRPNPDGYGWTVCTERLREQVRRWGCTHYLIQSNAKPKYESSFADPEDRAVSVTLTGGPHDGRTITVDRFERPVDNLWALAKGIESIRLNELRGLDDVARQIYQMLPAPKARRDPFEVLGLRPDADRETIDAVYRLKAKKLHPDAGGDPAEMAELNAAYAAAKGS